MVYYKENKLNIWEKNFAAPLVIIMFLSIFLSFSSSFLLIKFSGWVIALSIILINGTSIFIIMYNVIKYLPETHYIYVLKDNLLYVITYSQNVYYKNLKAKLPVISKYSEIDDDNNKKNEYLALYEYVKQNGKLLPNGAVSYLILTNPKIEKIKKNKLYISYDKDNIRQMRCYNNNYSLLVNDLKKLEPSIGTTLSAVDDINIKKIKKYNIKSCIIIGGIILLIIAISSGANVLLTTVLFFIIEILLWKIFMKDESTQKINKYKNNNIEKKE